MRGEAIVAAARGSTPTGPVTGQTADASGLVHVSRQDDDETAAPARCLCIGHTWPGAMCRQQTSGGAAAVAGCNASAAAPIWLAIQSQTNTTNRRRSRNMAHSEDPGPQQPVNGAPVAG